MRTIKVSAYLSHAGAPDDSLSIFEFGVSEAMTVERFVKELRDEGGVWLNKKRTDWVPLERIVRVWEK